MRYGGMVGRLRSADNADLWFWNRVAKSTDCWRWTGTTNEHGYGLITWQGRRHARTHRVAWELTHGAIPMGMHVLHHCDVPVCVRPEHLHLGTHQENMREAVERGRYNPPQAKWESCPRGHPFDERNTYVDPKTGWRRCRRCTADRANRYRQENPEARRQAQERWRAKQGGG